MFYKRSLSQRYNLMLGKLFQVRSLLSQGISPQHLDKLLAAQQFELKDISSFMYFIFTNKRSEFNQYLPLLMKHGGDINVLDHASQGITIFMTACLTGQVEIVKKMLEYPVDLSLKDSNGQSALILALNSYGQQKQKASRIISLILDRDHTQAGWEYKNRSALTLAVQNYNKETVKLLLDKGANLDFICSETNETALHLAVKKLRKKGDAVDITKMLIQRNINLSVKNWEGRLATDLDDPQAKQILESLLASHKKQSRKRSTHDVGKQILKSNNKMIRNNLEIVAKLNDPKEWMAQIQEAYAHHEQRLIQKIKRLQEEKKKREDDVRKLQDQWKLQVERNSDWIVPNNLLKHYLQEEILLFTDQIEKCNQEDQQQFDHLIELISQSLGRELNVQIKVYGSFATKLCLRESDIDVVVIQNSPQSGLQTMQLLQSIYLKLQELPFIQSSKFIKSAAIPVIKVTCNSDYRCKKIDLTLQNPRHNGLDCVEIIKEYIDIYKQLRPLAFVLKTFIYSSGLYDTYQGGISSYGLILMIVAFLQKEYALKKHDQRLMISDLLIKFLWFFGFEFDYVNKGIFVERPVDIRNKAPYKGFFFVVQNPMYQTVDPKLVLPDPLDMDNNVGRSTHQIKQIQKALCSAYSSIHASYNCRDPGCEYRKKIQRLQIPKDLEGNRVRPCCILKRMFQCSKSLALPS